MSFEEAFVRLTKTIQDIKERVRVTAGEIDELALRAVEAKKHEEENPMTPEETKTWAEQLAKDTCSLGD